jgi:Reverse transcriptase (RNA-dependent DNA polymerase)
LRRTPDGVPTKEKARLCARGDMMQKDVDCFESYSPVVQWSSVRLMLIPSIVDGLETRQVDYVNSFAQADLDREVYLETPQGFQHHNDLPCVLELHKSLYGMNDAPLMFFNLLRRTCCVLCFKQLVPVDPCLFVHRIAICLTYVDDCLWFGKDGAALDSLINEMKKMDLKDESKDMSDFLRMKFMRYLTTGTIIE